MSITTDRTATGHVVTLDADDLDADERYVAWLVYDVSLGRQLDSGNIRKIMRAAAVRALAVQLDRHGRAEIFAQTATGTVQLGVHPAGTGVFLLARLGSSESAARGQVVTEARTLR